MLIADALVSFAQDLSQRGKSSNTIVAYKGDVNQFISFLTRKAKSLDAGGITVAEIEEFKKDLLDNNYTSKSVSRKLNSIKNLFSFLKSKDIISTNPSAEVKQPKYENDTPKVLKPLEYRALRDAARNDLRASAIVELMLQAGLRIKEIESIRLEDIHDSEVFIDSYESHESRTVPLNNSAKMALKRYIDESRFDSKSKNVFVTKTGRKLLARNIRSLLTRYFEKADIADVKVNDLRNTFIVFQLKAGVPIDVVSQVVGHKRISTTEKYLELINGKEESKGIKLKEL